MRSDLPARPDNECPKLRAIDVLHHMENGQPFLLLRDPQQLSEEMLLVPQPLASVLAFCDGARDEAGVAAAFSKHFQAPIEPAVVRELLLALDRVYLLDNERSRQAMVQVLADYRTAPFRPLLSAGGAYPADPAELHGLLQNYLEDASAPPIPLADWPARAGLLSPHIDFPRGGAVYAEIWKAASEAVRAAELVILFGTDHYGDDPFTLTRQHYATPYGVLPTATPIVDALAGVIGEEAAFAGELRHRDEHSLELVAVWLHHMRGGEPVELVPILTGSLRNHVQNGGPPTADPMLERMLAKLEERSAGRRVLVVASGDLALVGPAFGGAPLDALARQRVRAADEALIAAMRAGDSEGFYETINRIDNRNNVCGVSPIYLTMRTVEGGGAGGEENRNSVWGERYGYAECPADERNTSAVTVAGMVFRPAEL